ncbi:MAG: TAXI family TRAP transporter solute-binding subunit [Thermodesulfobacteriota bacterium]
MERKKITFAGSVVGEPWWTTGEIVAKILKPHGYEVHISNESFSDNNVRWVTGRKAELGVCTSVHMRSAIKGIHDYKGEKHENLTLIATLRRPAWIGLAVRHEIGISDLRELKRRKCPLRILASKSVKGGFLDTVLTHHGLSLDEIEGWGGRFLKWTGTSGQVREGIVDMMLGNIYLGYTAFSRSWHEATTLFDMRFLSFDQALIRKLVKKYGYKSGAIPHGLFRGVDRDVPTVVDDYLFVYCLKSQPASLVRLVAEGLDQNSELFKQTRSAIYYERDEVWRSEVLPLHPAAEEYYRTKGYMGKE